MGTLVTKFPAISREFPVVVFANPSADGGRAAMDVSKAKKAFELRGIPVQFVTTRGANELKSIVKKAVEVNQRLLLTMGGDGTFHTLVNAAAGSGAVMGLLPAGGGNDLATELGLV